MTVTLIIGSRADAEDYMLNKNLLAKNLYVFKYPEHFNDIKNITSVVFHFLSYMKGKPKYILTESPYVIGYLCTLLKANALLDKGAEFDAILRAMPNFVKLDSKNFNAVELHGKECKDLMVTYDGRLKLISDENYPNIMLKQIGAGYERLMDLEELENEHGKY